MGKKKANGVTKSIELSDELAAVVGSSSLPRSQVVKKLWAYIKRHGLQDPKNRRMINCDDRLFDLFGKSQVHMLKMMGLLNRHFIG